jgi:hypothetical protein
MQDKHLFLDLKWPMMYAYPLFAFVCLWCHSWNMKWGNMDTIIIDVQDIKAKSNLEQDWIPMVTHVLNQS